MKPLLFKNHLLEAQKIITESNETLTNYQEEYVDLLEYIRLVIKARNYQYADKKQHIDESNEYLLNMNLVQLLELHYDVRSTML